MKKIFLIFISFIVLASCERKIDEFTPNANNVDFSTFVCVGNSMTAGFADGALYTSGQENSVANILANQLKTVGCGEFRQPLMVTENGVGFTYIGTTLYFTTKMMLKMVPDKNCDGSPVGTNSLRPAYAVENPNQQELMMQLAAPPTVTGPYNNMGVPGSTVKSLFIPGYGSQLGNPYFARFATNPLTTIIQDATVQQPTFFYLWIGSNDVLISAMAGTDALITPADTFTKYYNMAVGALLASGKSPKGILANVPDVSLSPFFTTISKQLPYNSVKLDSAQAAGLNTLYTMYGHPEIQWHTGYNPFVITTTTGQWVQMQPGDQFLLTLPTDSIKCRGMGVADQNATPLPRPYPIPGKYVLQKSEILNLQAAALQYNQVIAQAASSNNLALVDMNSYLIQLSSQSGMVFDGIKMTTTFVSGGVFSTDGLHLNPRGSAMAANFFIQAINARYGCNIPQANITDYPGLIFP